MNRTLPQWVSMALCMLAAGGCAATAPDDPRVTPRPLGRDLASYDASAPPPAPPEASGEMTLGHALALAVLHNPDLGVESWEVRAHEAAAIQARLRPNPQLSAEVENVAGTGVVAGFDAAEVTLALSQLIELGGERAQRLRLAQLDGVSQAWSYEARRIATLARTAKAFVSVLSAQESVALAEQLEGVAAGILEAVENRVRAGGASPIEASRARVALEASRIDRALAGRDLAVARRDLAAHWGSTSPSFSRAVGALDRVPGALPAVDTLLARVHQNPDVARWTTELDRRRTELAHARAERFPDLDVGAGWRYLSATDDAAFVFGFSLPLPIFDRRQGDIAVAELRAAQVPQAQLAAQVRIQRDVAAAHEALAGAHDEIHMLRERVLPEAESAFALSQSAFRQGRIRLTDVLDTQRTLFELKSRYVHALARYHTAAADLEGLVGEPLGVFE